MNVTLETSRVTAHHAQTIEQIQLKNEVNLLIENVETIDNFYCHVRYSFKELEKLEKRDIEIAQIAQGKVHRTRKYKASSKVRKDAFDEYMKMYLKERKQGVRRFSCHT
jgi:hypothetical protein